jgi:hypothetical protein
MPENASAGLGVTRSKTGRKEHNDVIDKWKDKRWTTLSIPGDRGFRSPASYARHVSKPLMQEKIPIQHPLSSTGQPSHMHKPVPDPNLSLTVHRRWSPIAGEAVTSRQSPEKDDVVIAPRDVCSIFAGCSYQKWWPFVAVAASCPQHCRRGIQHRRSRLAHLEASALEKNLRKSYCNCNVDLHQKRKNSATNHLKDLQLTKDNCIIGRRKLLLPLIKNKCR